MARGIFTELYWINGPWPGRLAIAARPRGGEWLNDEMRSWKEAGVHAVVSTLTPDEVDDLALEMELERCKAFPIVDRSVPFSTSEAMTLLERLDGELTKGRNVAIHCRQGVGRSGMLAAGVLQMRGLSHEKALNAVSLARG